MFENLYHRIRRIFVPGDYWTQQELDVAWARSEELSLLLNYGIVVEFDHEDGPLFVVL